MSKMLRDATNLEAPRTLKTFQRRVKEPSSKGAAADVGTGDGAPTEQGRQDSYGASLRQARSDSLCSAGALDGSAFGQAFCPGGFLRSLRDRRRSSVLVPLQSLLEKADYKANRNKSLKQRELRLLEIKKIVEELNNLFAEVDAFELTVEDPEPSPQPEKRRSKTRKCHDGPCTRSHRPRDKAGPEAPAAAGVVAASSIEVPSLARLGSLACPPAPLPPLDEGQVLEVLVRGVSDMGIQDHGESGPVQQQDGQQQVGAQAWRQEPPEEQQRQQEGADEMQAQDLHEQELSNLMQDQAWKWGQPAQDGPSESRRSGAKSLSCSADFVSGPQAAVQADAVERWQSRSLQQRESAQRPESAQHSAEQPNAQLALESGRRSSRPSAATPRPSVGQPPSYGIVASAAAAAAAQAPLRPSSSHGAESFPGTHPQCVSQPALSPELNLHASPCASSHACDEEAGEAATGAGVGLVGQHTQHPPWPSLLASPSQFPVEAALSVPRRHQRHSGRVSGALSQGQAAAPEVMADAECGAEVEAGLSAGLGAAAAADAMPTAAPELSVAVSGQSAESGRDRPVAGLAPLQRLLALCDQEPSLQPYQLPSMDDVICRLVGPSGDHQGGPTGATNPRGRGAAAARGTRAAKANAATRPAVVKVGEGSYGEAWRLGEARRGLVIKVVPIDGTVPYNGGAQKTSADMLSETLMCRELSRLADGAPTGTTGAGPLQSHWTYGFVRMHGVAVCRGPYPRDFVRAWEKWDTHNGSENDPISGLPEGQLYWVIAMSDSGKDLEKYELQSWDQVRSVLLQTAVSLAVAEAALSFEHRDLHWGNVLVRPVTELPDCLGGWVTARLRGHTLKVASCGVFTTIIDFTNSRLEAPDGSLAFCDLSQDPEVFQGPRGDVQFDTYRWMQRLLGDDWSSSCLATNCLWVSYLAEVMAKRFGSPGGGGVRLSAAEKRQLRDFRKRATAYGSCSELMMDDLFRGLLQVEA